MTIQDIPRDEVLVWLACCGLFCLSVVVSCVLLSDMYDSFRIYQDRRNSEEIE